MDNKQFKKGIDGWKKVRLSNEEKETMLQSIFATPIKSPFVFQYRQFAFALSLFLMVSVGVLNVSANALPGDILYPIKTKIVEPIVGSSLNTPEERVVWEETKIDRRIAEAEKLIEKNDLDEKKWQKLEESIKKSSKSFVTAAELVASSTSSTTSLRKEKANNIKKELRQKIEEKDDERKSQSRNSQDRRGDEDDDDKDKEKLKKLRDSVIQVLDEEDGEDREGGDEEDGEEEGEEDRESSWLLRNL